MEEEKKKFAVGVLDIVQAQMWPAVSIIALEKMKNINLRIDQ